MKTNPDLPDFPPPTYEYAPIEGWLKNEIETDHLNELASIRVALQGILEVMKNWSSHDGGWLHVKNANA